MIFRTTSRTAIATVALAALGSCTRAQPATTSTPPTDIARERYIDTCLNEDADDESGSRLWHDLAKWALAVPDEELHNTSEEALLDRAAVAVRGLDSEAAWSSAGRYFQAENLHDLERPACARALRARK